MTGFTLDTKGGDMIQYPCNMKNTRVEKVFIGIDPGLKGAVAFVKEDGSASVFALDPDTFIDLVRPRTQDTPPAAVVLEHVGGMPGQSAPAAFNFGDGFGFLRGVLHTLSIPYELVRPAKWKKEFSCTADKNTSIAVARRLFPKVSLRRTDRCRKDDDGFAEALLMAEYARRHMA